MQVYRGMDIGTAKPSLAEQAEVPHHLIDLVEPEESFSVADFQSAARAVLADHGGRRMIVVGGSGLHVRALLDPLEFPPHDPAVRQVIDALPPEESRERLRAADSHADDVLDLANPRRVQRALEILEITGLTPSQRALTAEARAVAAYEPLVPFVGFGIDAGEALGSRVADRTDAMIEAGFVAEVRSLAGRLGVTARSATGYPEFGAYVAGESSLDEAVSKTRESTVALAKRQRTFFRRDPRIVWLDWHDDPVVRYDSFRAQLDKLGLWNS